MCSLYKVDVDMRNTSLKLLSYINIYIYIYIWTIVKWVIKYAVYNNIIIIIYIQSYLSITNNVVDGSGQIGDIGVVDPSHTDSTRG